MMKELAVILADPECYRISGTAFSSVCFAGQKLQIEKKTSFSRSRIRQ
jgi:hypothetical protein